MRHFILEDSEKPKKMKPMVCVCCSAPINPHTYHCDYCGAEYEKPSGMVLDPPLIIKYPGRIERVMSKIEIDGYEYREMAHDEGFQEYMVERLANDIARHLIPYMDFATEFIIDRNVYALMAEMKVLRKDTPNGSYSEMFRFSPTSDFRRYPRSEDSERLYHTALDAFKKYEDWRKRG